jgi:urea transport system substrate-binding protein
MSNEDQSGPIKIGSDPVASKGNRTDDESRFADTFVEKSPAKVESGNYKEWIGKSIGKYQIVDVLGKGAMGVVFKGYDPVIDREVAIKMLADDLAEDNLALGRFFAEARSAGKLIHPNVMAIYDVFQDGRNSYLVLELVTGGSLEDRLDKLRVLPILEATQVMIDACKGVGAAHAAGLTHRDIKPANFMRTADGVIKVADFGLAKGTGEGARHFTQTGMVVGTPYFMSPEQCESKPVDHRSDIYSLGATYYCLLTGKCPYQTSEGIPQLMFAHCHGPIPDPRAIDASLPEACTRIIARAMAKAPADRYQSTAEMIEDLQAVVAALSGTAKIALPSESAIAAAAAVQPPCRPASNARLYAVMLGVLLVALAGMTMAIWRPWQASSGGGVVGPAGEPIKVGVLHSLSGTMQSSESPVMDTVLFAIDEINASGGVLGRPVHAVVADGRSDDAVFAKEADRLITKEKVVTVFGCWTSASRKTVKPIFEQHDHLLVYPLQYEGLETSPCITYLGAAPNQQILPALKWATSSGFKKRFFLVGSDYVFPRAANAIIKDQMKIDGHEIVGEEYALFGNQKFDAVVRAIAKAKPDMILNTLNGDSNVGFFRTLRDAGIKSKEIPTLSFSIDEEGLRSLNAASLEGDYAAWTYFQSIASPENEKFVKAFEAKHPQHSITDAMESAYLGVKLWAKAVNEAKSVEPKNIRLAMRNQRLLGPCGEVRIDADTQHCYRTPRIGQITSDGTFKVVWTAPEPVRPEPYPRTRTAEAWRAFLNDLYTGWGNRWSR